MKGKHLICVMVLLLGACLTVGGCSDTRYVLVPAAPTQVSDGVYDFQPPVSTQAVAFVDMTITIRGLQQNFSVAPVLWFDPNEMGFQTYAMNYVQSNIYRITISNVVTNTDVSLNFEDPDFGGFMFNQNGLDPTYPDQLITVSVSLDGGVTNTPVTRIQGNDLEFSTDEYGNMVVPRYDMTIVYMPPAQPGMTVPPDLYFAWYFDPLIAEPQFQMVQNAQGNWQVTLLHVPSGIYEANVDMNTGPHDVAVRFDGTNTIIRGGFTFSGVPITDVVWYVVGGYDPLFPEFVAAHMANLLLRIDPNGGITGVPGGTVVYINAP